jgi:purine-binding chemotaxis protein CheW
MPATGPIFTGGGPDFRILAFWGRVFFMVFLTAGGNDKDYRSRMEDTVKKFLCFEVASRRFGLWSTVVMEAVRAVAVVPLPKAPAMVTGVINLRGKVVPVFDLRSRFGLPAKEVEITDHFVVAWAGERIVAFQADRAVGFFDATEKDVEDAKGVTPVAEYLSGIVKMPDGLVLIHDPATFLSRAEERELAVALGESA